LKYLKVWTNFREVIQNLSLEEKGELFDAMLAYAETQEEPETLTGNAFVIWPVAKRDIDMAAEWRETCRANGLKGGRPKTDKNPTKPTETQPNPEEPTNNLKEKKRNEMKGNEKKGITRFTPPTAEEVALYCKERRNNVNADRFCAFYESKGWRVGNQPMKDWRAAVRTWEQRDKVLGKVVSAQAYTQRDYSGETEAAMSEHERQMEEWLKGGAAG
jgi:hypothetical protein